MRLRVLLLLLAAATARAQFSGLTTTNDGSTVWFSSALRLRGTDQHLWPKIFRIDGNGAALVAQRDRSSPVPPTNPFMLGQPQVTGDGQWLLYRGTLICGAGSSCFLSEQHSTTLRNNVTGEETAGRAQCADQPQWPLSGDVYLYEHVLPAIRFDGPDDGRRDVHATAFR